MLLPMILYKHTGGEYQVRFSHSAHPLCPKRGIKKGVVHTPKMKNVQTETNYEKILLKKKGEIYKLQFQD